MGISMWKKSTGTTSSIMGYSVKELPKLFIKKRNKTKQKKLRKSLSWPSGGRVVAKLS